MALKNQVFERSLTESQSMFVVIPALNEAATLGLLLEEIRQSTPAKIVLVDDVSTDETADLARAAGAVVLSLPLRLGAWGATQTGIEYAIGQGAEVVVTMDADGQHDPALIDFLSAPVREGEADLCIGAFIQRGTWLRKLAWKLLRSLSGLAIEDITSGFRAYSRRAASRIIGDNVAIFDYQDVGVLQILHRQNMLVIEVPTTMHAREQGISRIYGSWKLVFEYMAYTVLLALSNRQFFGKKK